MKRTLYVLVALLAVWSAVPAAFADDAPRPLRLENRSCEVPATAIDLGERFLMNLPAGAPLPSPAELANVPVCNCTGQNAPTGCPPTICPSVCRVVTCISPSACLNGVC